MPGKQPFHKSVSRTTWRCVTVALLMSILGIPAWTQKANVPPTAREAAASPAFAAKLHPSTPTAVGKAPTQSGNRRASPQDQVIYENGPVNGTTDAWSINFGYLVSDTFVSNGSVAGSHFYVWEFPGDTMTAVDWSIGTTPFASDIAKGTASTSAGTLSDQFLSTNQYGYNIDLITITGLNGSSGWFTLQNAVVPSGDPIYWDENSGVGCHSSGCPSQAMESALGTIPSEAFDITSNGPGCFQPSGRLQILHNFTPQEPAPGQLVEGAGGFYSTNGSGGDYGLGLAYEMNWKNNWVPTPIYSFTGGYNGYSPYPPIVDQHGALYGYASGGIQNCGQDGKSYCGLIYRLRPSPVACRNSMCSWTEDVLYRQAGNEDPMPDWNLGFDQLGNLYGFCLGGICELMPARGGWTDKLLYSLTGYGYGTLLVGNDGDLYGINCCDGDFGFGTVYQLAPSENGWTKNIIYSFHGQSDGGYPQSLFQDIHGNLFGSYFTGGGYYNGQSTFELSPSNGLWVLSVVFQTKSNEGFTALGMDSERLYGIGGIVTGGYGCSGLGCSAPVDPAGTPYYYGFFSAYLIYGFSGNGQFPVSGLVVGPGGQSMVGTTSSCGKYGSGTLWQW